MTGRIAKWGNSLAVRVPRAVAAEAAVKDGDIVEVTVEAGAIVVRPAARQYRIEDLVGGITKRNLHRESDWGDPVGNEAW